MQRITNKPLFDLGRPCRYGDWGNPRYDRPKIVSASNMAPVLSSYRTAAGETTLLTALGKFIPPDERILLIEDTAEIHLHHENRIRFRGAPRTERRSCRSVRDFRSKRLSVIGRIRSGSSSALVRD